MLRKIFGYLAALYAFSGAIGTVLFLLLFVFSDGEMFGDAEVLGAYEGFGMDAKTILLMGLVVNFMFCLGGAFVARLLLKSNSPTPEDRSHEQIILDLAVLSDGTLSIAEIAARTSLSVAEAKAGIEALTVAGVAFVEFNEQEDVFYRFPGLGQKIVEKEIL